MKKKLIITTYIAVVAVTALISGTAWANRVLVKNADTVVMVEESYACGRVIDIEVKSDSPDVFENKSIRMQTLVDSVQAILRYECPDMRSVRIKGSLRGLDQSAYAGVANWKDRWEVTTNCAIEAREVAEASQSHEDNTGVYTGDAVIDREMEIASIKLDMTVDEVRHRIREVFGFKPDYDPVLGTMNLELGGCPADHIGGGSVKGQANPDWVCTKAWFTDRRIARLYKLGYTQVVREEMRGVRNALIDNFGKPRINKQLKGRKGIILVWDFETVGVDGQVATESLEGKLFRSRQHIVIDLVLQDPKLVQYYEGSAKDRSNKKKPHSSVKLKL